MPQRNLLDSALDWTAIRLSWEDESPDLVASFRCTLHVQRGDGSWSAVVSTRWQGLMVDFVQTYTSEVMAAWMYGTPEDVLRVSRKVHRDAGRHAQAHAYD